MTLILETVPCLADNYAFLVHDDESGATALFDAPEAFPIQRVLEAKGWTLTDIFITHHHADHIDAVGELVSATGARVTGAQRDAHRLPPLDVAVAPDDLANFAGHAVAVIDAGGHTTGHVAYYMPALGAVFTGDSLMAMGCGRLFEGSAADMWATLTRLCDLPDDTLVCSGHEYTAANARFAKTVDLVNPALEQRIAEISAARTEKRATVPSVLGVEKATNPFLRASNPEVKQGLGMAAASDEAVFAHIRDAKDKF